MRTQVAHTAVSCGLRLKTPPYTHTENEVKKQVQNKGEPSSLRVAVANGAFQIRSGYFFIILYSVLGGLAQ